MNAEPLPTVERLMLMMLFLHERLFSHWINPKPLPVIFTDELVIMLALRKRGFVQQDEPRLTLSGTEAAQKMWVKT